MEQKYLFVAVDAALRAGEKILSIYNDPASDFEIERKADNSPLTIADRKAHETIATILQETPFPLLSEEGKHMEYAMRKNWSTLWIVDPLDGTKEFIKRNGEFTVNIALVHDGIPVMGVIYLPVKQELYFAAESLGAFKLSGITALGDSASLEELMPKGKQMYILVLLLLWSGIQLPDMLSRVRQEWKFIRLAKRCHYNTTKKTC